MKKVYNRLIGRNIFSVLLVVTISSIFLKQSSAADEVPAFFLKIAKNIPRIGRSEPEDYLIRDSSGKDNPWFKRVNQVTEISKRKVGFLPETDTWSWQHFPLAIEGPPELWRTLAGYSRDPLYRTTDDFNNDLWSRDKRTNDPSQEQ